MACSRPNVRLSDSELEPVTEQIASFCEAAGGRRPSALREDLQRVMWETLIVEKDAESLARAREAIVRHRQHLADDLYIAAPFDLALSFEHLNLLDVAEVIVEAASARTESRGSHYRSDYPSRDDNTWLTNLLVSRRNGTLRLDRHWISQERGWVDQKEDVRIVPWG